MRSRRRLPLGLAMAAALMAVLVYLNALDNPFVYDDYRTVVENGSIRDLGYVRAISLHDAFRPVVNFSYALDYALWGLRPFGFHLTGVLLHAANVLLLFVLTRRLVRDCHPVRIALRSGRAARASAEDGDAEGSSESSLDRHGHESSAAFAAAAMYAVHPMMTQAVGYVSGRAEVLCVFFALAAMLGVHVWLIEGERRWLALSLACWLLALGSKEVAVMLPFALVAYDALVLSRAAPGARERLSRIYGPLLVVVAAAAAVRVATFFVIENSGRASLTWSHALVDLSVVRRYISLMVLPVGQSIFHSERSVSSLTDPLALFNLAWLVAFATLAWKARRREPMVTFGAIWFLLMLIPSSVMLLLNVGEPMAEQRVYLAACGLAMGLGAVFGRLREWPPRSWVPARALVTLGLAVLLLNWAPLTVARNQVWSDPVRLWSEAVFYAPDVWVPYRGLGDAFRQRGDYVRAVEAYRTAARLNPNEVRTYVPLGMCLILTGRLTEAEEAFASATRLSPGLAEAETGLALVARLGGRTDEARDRLLAVIRAHPEAVAARQVVADMYEHEYTDPTSALRVCREIEALAPQTPGVADCIRRNQQGAARGGYSSSRR